MKRSIFYLFCAVAVGGAACKKVPEASDSSPNAMPTATPEATATPTPVGEQLRPRDMPERPSQQSSPSHPEAPYVPGAGKHTPSGSQAEPPHRKPPVSAKMEV